MECTGEIPGVRFLNGITQEGRVALSPSGDPPFNGAHWAWSDDGSGGIVLRCLGTIVDPDHIFLNGLTQSASADLAPNTDFPFTGTHWAVQEDAIFMPVRRFFDSQGGADQRILIARYDGLSWTILTTLDNVGSLIGPSAVIFNDRIFMVWRGVDGDQGIWTSSSADGVNWDPQRPIEGIGSIFGPSVAVFRNNIYMAWRGINDDQNIWWSRTADGVNWDPNPQARLNENAAAETSRI